MALSFVFWLTATAYAAAFVLFLLHLGTQQGSQTAARFAPWALALAAVAHGTYIVWASFVSRVCPVQSVRLFISLSAMLASGAYLFLRRRSRMDALGAFLSPVALALLLSSKLGGDLRKDVSGLYLAVHVTINLVGVAFLLLACGVALLYVIEERRLKTRRVGPTVARLPPLDTLDRAEHRFLLLGFALLTMGIVSGTLAAHRLFLGNTTSLVRAALATLTWGVFGSVLLSRALWGWRGRRAAYGTITGFLFALAILMVYLARANLGVLS